jgi:hypothetical protein
LKIPEDTFVARALVLAPSEYASALTAEKRIMEISGETLTLDDIRASMDTLYMTNYSATARAARENSQANHEIQLSNVNSGRNGRSGRGGRGGRGSGRFVCFKCRKAGHTASHCRSNQTTAQNNNNNGNVRHCNYCGKDGHLEHTCWLKPGNRVPGRAVRGLQDELRELRASTVARNSGRANTNETV